MTSTTNTNNKEAEISATKPSARQFVFGVDIDGVCGKYIAGLKKTVAKAKNVPPETLTDEISWNCHEWGITPEDYTMLHLRAVEEDRLFLNMEVYEGASEALWELSNADVCVRIISHRLFMSGCHAIAAGDTVRWLDNVNIPYRDICFVGGKQEVEADVYIEDSPYHIESLRANGKSVIVFDQPYNRELAGPRVSTWEEAKELVFESMRIFNIFH